MVADGRRAEGGNLTLTWVCEGRTKGEREREREVRCAGVARVGVFGAASSFG